MAISRFARGASTYTCDVCGRLTRKTGVQSLGSKTCPQCFDLAGLENEVSDGWKTDDEARRDAQPLVDDIKSKGGNVSDWLATFGLTADAPDAE